VAVDLMQGRAMVTAEVEKIGDLRTNVRGGGEFQLTDAITLRAGFDGSSPAGGFTVHLPQDLRLDYGTGDHDLGMIHRFSLSWRFGGFYANSSSSQQVISPLGTRPATQFSLDARTRDAVDSWRLEIHDQGENLVRQFGGRGAPPAHLMWDGKTAAGMPLPDGSYRYRLVVQDLGGLEIVGRSQTIGIDTRSRDIQVPVQVSGTR
jgi:hypothetical protein